MSKLNLNDCSVSPMTIQEKMNTIGGDPFLSDLGDFFKFISEKYEKLPNPH